MGGFAQYYVEFLGKLWNNICEWFMNHISIIVNVFYGDFAEAGGYFPLLPCRTVSQQNGAGRFCFPKHHRRRIQRGKRNFGKLVKWQRTFARKTGGISCGTKRM